MVVLQLEKEKARAFKQLLLALPKDIHEENKDIIAPVYDSLQNALAEPNEHQRLCLVDFQAGMGLTDVRERPYLPERLIFHARVILEGGMSLSSPWTMPRFAELADCEWPEQRFLMEAVDGKHPREVGLIEPWEGEVFG